MRFSVVFGAKQACGSDGLRTWVRTDFLAKIVFVGAHSSTQKCNVSRFVTPVVTYDVLRDGFIFSSKRGADSSF
jgi:hypothetical protein